MKNFLRKIDYVGYTPKMYFQNQMKFKTLIGGVLTIIISVLTILASISFGDDIYLRKNPAILLNKNFIEPEYNMTQQNIIGYRLFFTGGKRIPELNRLVDIFMLHTVFDPNLQESTLTRYEMIKCSNADIYKQNFLNLTNIIKFPEDYYCFPNNVTIYLKGKYGAPINNHMHFRINICQNSTKNNNSCYPDEVIRKKMSSFFASFLYKDSFIDGKDYENPVKYYITSNTLKSSSYTFRQDAYLFKDITFKTDSGIILPNDHIENYTQLETISSGSTAEFNTVTFTNVIVGLTNLKDNYSRKYIKLQDISAQVGGIIKFFLIFSDFFISFYSYIPFLETLYERLFDENKIIIKKNINKLYKRDEINNSESNLAVPKLIKISCSKIEERDKKNNKNDIITNINNIHKVNNNQMELEKEIQNKKQFNYLDKNDLSDNHVINHKKYSFCEIIFQCFKKKNSANYRYLNKITKHFEKNFDIEKIFLHEFKVNNLYEYTFNKDEQNIIELYSVIRFYEGEKQLILNEFKESNEQVNISQSKIFTKLKIPKELI